MLPVISPRPQGVAIYRSVRVNANEDKISVMVRKLVFMFPVRRKVIHRNHVTFIVTCTTVQLIGSYSRFPLAFRDKPLLIFRTDGTYFTVKSERI